MLHLSLPIANSVDPAPTLSEALPFSVHACQPHSRGRNECLRAIRGGRGNESGEWRRRILIDHVCSEKVLILRCGIGTEARTDKRR